MIRKHRKKIITFVLLWILTLGVHVSHTTTFWPSNWFEGDQREAFESGERDCLISVSLNAYETQSYGLPFLAQYTRDTAPYSMALVLWTSPDDVIKDVQISGFSISSRLQDTINLENLVVHTGQNTEGHYARIEMPDYLGEAADFTVRVTGSINTGSRIIAFDETLLQEVDWNVDVFLGWYLVLLRAAFG